MVSDLTEREGSLPTVCLPSCDGHPMIFIRRRSLVLVCLAFAASFLLTACSSGQSRTDDLPASTVDRQDSLFADPDELARVWQASQVRIPDGAGGVIQTDIGALEAGTVSPEAVYPLVVYLHGCNGFWSGTQFRLEWLARNGFAVIAPSSFARDFYPESCNVQTRESGLYRPTLIMRQFDAGYAIEQARAFPWVQTDTIFLMGLSEGAAVASTFSTLDKPAGYLRARVVESWTCHSGWSEFLGINAHPSEAVLSLVADHDPWYTRAFHQGTCAEFMSEVNGSQSFVVDYPPLRDQHELMEDPAIQEIVLDFLLRQSLDAAATERSYQ